MAKQINHFYEFGTVRIDATNRLLYKDGKQLPLGPRVVDTLLVLVKNANAIVEKDMLLNAVWQDAYVEEGVLKRNVSILRKALGDEGQLIETLPKRGYRFNSDVKVSWAESPFYGVDDPTDELSLERRASLRITHEEEVSDSSDSRVDVPSYTSIKQTQVPQTNATSYLRSRAVTVSAVAVVVLLATLGFWWVTSKPVPAASAPINSIAVLPLKNLASHGEDEHLGIGIADTLITRLSNIKDLKVRPTSAVLNLNGKEQDSITSGQMLGVDAVLEGSIYRVGDRTRVTVRLMRVKDQSPLWAGQFDERERDFLSMQNAIAHQIASSLALNLSSTEKNALTKRYTESTDAYQLYITGRYHWNKRNKAAGVKAESFFRQAIEKDPNFALAYLGLADTLVMGSVYEESLFAIEKALKLDDQLGEGYASRGFWKMFKAWQWDEAEADFRRSIELKPGYGTAHQWYATLLAIRERVEEAKAEMRRALEVDPMSHNFLADMGQMHYFAREYADAENYCRKALELYPDFLNARIYLSDILLRAGDEGRAFDEEMKAVRVILSDSERDIAEATTTARELYYRSGYKGYWRAGLDRLLHRTADGFSYYGLVKHYTLLGEKEKALDSLEKSYESRDFMLPFVNVDPLYDGLRSEPRFQAVFRRMGLLQ
jgi:DNA-binding winged helix-turn-helix (wHTH) protein/TolB-like protein